MLKSEYVLQQTESIFCPTCNSNVSLLIHGDAIETPSFYICFKCGYVAEVGVGPVFKVSNEEVDNIIRLKWSTDVKTNKP